MNIGHEAPLRVGKLIAVFCSCSCAERSAGTMRIAAINSVRPIRLTMTSSLHPDLEELFCVVFEDHLLFSSAQKFEAFDDVARLVKPLPCFRIFYRTDARPLRAEQAAVASEGFEQQRHVVCRVQNCVVIEIPHLIRKPRTAAA